MKAEPDEFDLPYPLGRIIFEKNIMNDATLKYLNTVPEYIAFVNEVQRRTFNGSFSASTERAYSTELQMLGRKYRLYGKPFRGESVS